MQKWKYLRLDMSHAEDTTSMTPNFDLARTVSVKASGLIASLDRPGDR